MRRVSLLLASLPGGNPGMLAVNRAAKATMAELGVEVQTYEAVKRTNFGDGGTEGIAKELLLCTEEAFAAERILLWGDWLHMHNYLTALTDDAGRMLTPPGRPVTFEQVSGALLLEGLEDHRLHDVAIVGTTLALDGPIARTEPGYSGLVERLHAGAGLVRMRDSFSAGLAETWRDGRDSCAGLDAAFLYRPQGKPAPSERSGGDGPMVGYFIGRTSRPFIPRLSAFAHDLVIALEARPVWVPWIARPYVELRGLERPSRLLRIQKALGRRSDASTHSTGTVAPEVELDDLIEQIRDCTVVITDTYHLAVIAWGQGVPCVLFGEASNANTKRINGGWRFQALDKRLAMLETLDAVPFYVPIEDLSDAAIARARIEYLANEVLATSRLADHVRSTIERRRRMLLDALHGWVAA